MQNTQEFHSEALRSLPVPLGLGLQKYGLTGQPFTNGQQGDTSNARVPALSVRRAQREDQREGAQSMLKNRVLSPLSDSLQFHSARTADERRRGPHLRETPSMRRTR